MYIFNWLYKAILILWYNFVYIFNILEPTFFILYFVDKSQYNFHYLYTDISINLSRKSILITIYLLIIEFHSFLIKPTFLSNIFHS